MQNLRRAFLVLITYVLAGLGCTAHGCPVPPRLVDHNRAIVDVRIYISPEFTPEEHNNIVNGILMWERATNGLIVWHLMSFDPKNSPPKPAGCCGGVQQRSVMFRRATSGDEWVKKWDAEHRPKTLLGLCQGNSLEETAWLWLVENRLNTSESESVIAAHELGHALGLDHTDDKDSVMSEFFRTSTRCLTVHDLRAFCDKYGCNTEGMEPICTPSKSH